MNMGYSILWCYGESFHRRQYFPNERQRFACPIKILQMLRQKRDLALFSVSNRGTAAPSIRLEAAVSHRLAA